MARLHNVGPIGKKHTDTANTEAMERIRAVILATPLRELGGSVGSSLSADDPLVVV